MFLPAKSKVWELGSKTLDFVLPPRCVATGRLVDRQGMVDSGFWARLRFIADPQCSRCGLPFDFAADDENGSDGLCASCLAKPPVFDQARAALVYDEASRRIILGYKYGDKTHASLAFAQWLCRAGADLIRQSDIIAPVPLHRFRLWQRRFNQSALLAQSVSSRTGLDCRVDLLTRHRATPQQKGLSPKERLKNVRNAFAVRTSHQNDIKGKSVLLIDDVYTSGATLNECAHALKKSGAQHVYALVLARAVRQS